MGICCMALIYLQVSYIDTMIKMRKEHFEEGVRRSLYQVAYNLELEEMREYLSKNIEKDVVRGQFNDGGVKLEHSYVTSSENGNVVSRFEFKTFVLNPPHFKAKVSNRDNKHSVDDAQRLSLDVLRMRYKYQRAVLDEVVYNMLYQASEKPLNKRIDFNRLCESIKLELANNGINLPYHFRVLRNDGSEVYRCPDYSNRGGKKTGVYREMLFKNDPPTRAAVLEVKFPITFLNNYIFRSVKFMIPSLLFTFVLLITFVITLYLSFRQKKFNEMKNDFINNMTHEFKTPISTISLAAQMLNDEAVTKSPNMFRHISGIINDETKRLRFQVEKALQMSMFERRSNTLKFKELNVEELINGVVNTFAIKVENCGGAINLDFEAENPFVMADEMHLTNVIFNLMDNAVKYKKEDDALQLDVRTWNEQNKLIISIADNGIGMRKEDLKRVFDKFYRVHTANRHDVKGFGLGLAYVKKVVTNHKGTIRAESEFGQGTKFIITLPLNIE